MRRTGKSSKTHHWGLDSASKMFLAFETPENSARAQNKPCREGQRDPGQGDSAAVPPHGSWCARWKGVLMVM